MFFSSVCLSGIIYVGRKVFVDLVTTKKIKDASRRYCHTVCGNKG